LAEGTNSDTNLLGALGGMTIADLLTNMVNGNAYDNIHATQNPD